MHFVKHSGPFCYARWLMRLSGERLCVEDVLFMRVLGLCLSDLAAQLREQGGVMRSLRCTLHEGFALLIGQGVRCRAVRGSRP